jgi:tetratricopeptide (TPR) repeat protein
MKKIFLILLFIQLCRIAVCQCVKDPLFIKGEQFLNIKNIQQDSALKYFDKSIEKFPECSQAYFWKAFIRYSYFNDSKNAIEYYTKFIEINSSDSSNVNKPNLSNAYTNRAICKIALNNLEGARIDFDNAILNDHSNPNHYFNRGALSMQLKEYKKAKNDFTLAIKYVGSLPANYVTYTECSGVTEASIRKSKTMYYFNRALAEDSMGDHKEAIADLDKARWLSKSSYFNYYRANSFLVSGDTLKAIKDFKLFIGLYNNKDVKIRENALLKLSKLFYYNQDYKSSLKFTKKGLREFPENTEFVRLMNLLKMKT